MQVNVIGGVECGKTTLIGQMVRESGMAWSSTDGGGKVAPRVDTTVTACTNISDPAVSIVSFIVNKRELRFEFFERYSYEVGASRICKLPY